MRFIETGGGGVDQGGQWGLLLEAEELRSGDSQRAGSGDSATVPPRPRRQTTGYSNALSDFYGLFILPHLKTNTQDLVPLEVF